MAYSLNLCELLWSSTVIPSCHLFIWANKLAVKAIGQLKILQATCLVLVHRVDMSIFGSLDVDQHWAYARYHWGATARLSSRRVGTNGIKGVKVWVELHPSGSSSSPRFWEKTSICGQVWNWKASFCKLKYFDSSRATTSRQVGMCSDMMFLYDRCTGVVTWCSWTTVRQMLFHGFFNAVLKLNVHI